MRKVILSLFLLVCALCVNAHKINEYKYIVIEHIDDSPKDVEQRLSKEFPNMGFVLISSEDVSQLTPEEQQLVLTAEYLCRQSAQCLFKIKLKNLAGEVVYEDEQVAAGGFMSYKNDRQSAIKKIFKQLGKLNYQFTPVVSQ